MASSPPRVGVLWSCDDDECACTQPEVRERVRERALGVAERWEVIWAGTFVSQATRPELASQVRELRAACRRLGAQLLRPY